MKILLVDDSSTMRNIQRKVLSEGMGEPVEFVEAGDGMEGMCALVTSGPFDVVLVDWNMPTMDGITLVQMIRERDKTTPLVMATTEAEKTRVIAAIKSGVNNYVVKPFTPEQLVERVKQTVQRATQKAAA